MAEKHYKNGCDSALIPGSSKSVLSNVHRIEVESIDGAVVQMSVEGTDTIAQVRQRALEQIGMGISHVRKYVITVADAQNERNLRVVDEKATIDQILSDGQTLSFQLIPQVAFGPQKKVYNHA